MTTLEALTRCVREFPHDPTPRNVLADYLEEQGTPEKWLRDVPNDAEFLSHCPKCFFVGLVDWMDSVFCTAIMNAMVMQTDAQTTREIDQEIRRRAVLLGLIPA